MTTPSHYKSFMPTVSSYEPLIDATTTPFGYSALGGQYFGDLTSEVDGWSHQTAAFGGYYTANFSITGKIDLTEDWLINGVGRHIIARDFAMVPFWEGFVNKVTASIGGATIIRGPLLDIGNYVNLFYSTVDNSVDPPIVGLRKATGYASHTTSQAKYGKLETFLSAGGMTRTAALQARDTYLSERAYPKTTQSFNTDSATYTNVQVECLGYVHFLSKYTYYLRATGTDNVNNLIIAVLDAQLNGIFSSDQLNIDTNTLQESKRETDRRKAMDVVKGLVALGDASDNRWLFGIYEQQKPYYNQAPTDFAYVYSVNDSGQRIFTANNELVYPWNLRPGKWLRFADILIGRYPSSVSPSRDDPRHLFIESVNYSAPWSVTVTGGDTDTLAQRLAKLGLAGIGG